MENLEYIENYLKSQPTPEETKAFEERITTDGAFAEDVAFYIATQQVAAEAANEERKNRFKQIDISTPVIGAAHTKVVSMRRITMYAAACVLLVALVMSWLFLRPVSSEKLASDYINSNLTTLSVNMGKEDSMQSALQLFNSGKLQEALAMFEAIYAADPTKDVAARYAGISALRLQQYDKAIVVFEDLAKKNLYANPAKFYWAITLMKRNQPDDKEKAHGLLKEVVEQNLAGRDIAEQWLKKM